MSLKTNIEYWNELEKNGWLYFHLKDGKPESFIDHLIALSYPIIIVLILVLSFFYYSRLANEKKRFKSLIACMSTAAILGWTWGGLMIHADPVFPSWLFPPWSVSNIELFLALEDILFYPFATGAFYIVYRNINIEDVVENRTLMINLVIFLYSLLSLFYLMFTGLCGQSVTIFFVIPGILLFIYSKDELNIKKFFYFQPVPILVGWVWDWTATSLVRETEGKAWASQYVYISFNEAGEHNHSSVFLDYAEYPWAWIFYSPIAITPWLGMAGVMFNFSLFVAVDKFFDKRGVVQ